MTEDRKKLEEFLKEDEFGLEDLIGYECIKINDGLYVVENFKEKGYDELLFLQVASVKTYPRKGYVTVSPFFLIRGFSETLREGRHTYFPDNGYIFYISKVDMETALDYCTKYFDMD